MIPTADLRTIAFDRVFLLSEDEAHAPSAKTLEPLSPAARESVVRMALRRLAFQVLFELDMGGRDRAWAADALSRVEGLGPMDAERVAALATGAWEARAAADTEFLALAPDWPSHRLAAADRAVLRLAHFEMVSHSTPPEGRGERGRRARQATSPPPTPLPSSTACWTSVLQRVHRRPPRRRSDGCPRDMGLFRGVRRQASRRASTKTREGSSPPPSRPQLNLLTGRSLDDDLIEETRDPPPPGRRRRQDHHRTSSSRIRRRRPQPARSPRGEQVHRLTSRRELKRHVARGRTAPSGSPPPRPTVIVMTGVNGVGKDHLHRQALQPSFIAPRAASVLLGACDTFRAGAVRQLEIWAERLGVEVVRGQQGGDPACRRLRRLRRRQGPRRRHSSSSTPPAASTPRTRS
jgi:hypothetical protein